MQRKQTLQSASYFPKSLYICPSRVNCNTEVYYLKIGSEVFPKVAVTWILKHWSSMDARCKHSRSNARQNEHVIVWTSTQQHEVAFEHGIERANGCALSQSLNLDAFTDSTDLTEIIRGKFK